MSDTEFSDGAKAPGLLINAYADHLDEMARALGVACAAIAAGEIEPRLLDAYKCAVLDRVSDLFSLVEPSA